MYKVTWRFLTPLLLCSLACLFITGRAETSPQVTIIGQRVDLCAMIVKGQDVAVEGYRNPSNLVVSSSSKVGSEMKLRKSDNGKEITIKIGDVLQIELERSGGTGYEWYLDQSYKKHFELMGEDTETRQDRGLVGTPVMKKWKLRAIERGETDICLSLYREWEGKDKAVETYRIRARIV